jgi:hypothetical protein
LKNQSLAFFGKRRGLIRTGRTKKKECERREAKLGDCKQERLQIKYGGHAYLKKNGTASVDVVFSSTAKLNIEKLLLELGGKRFQPLDWSPFILNNSQHSFSSFDLNTILDGVSEDKLKSVNLIALTGGTEYRSPDFDISSMVL